MLNLSDKWLEYMITCSQLDPCRCIFIMTCPRLYCFTVLWYACVFYTDSAWVHIKSIEKWKIWPLASMRIKGDRCKQKLKPKIAMHRPIRPAHRDQYGRNGLMHSVPSVYFRRCSGEEYGSPVWINTLYRSQFMHASPITLGIRRDNLLALHIRSSAFRKKQTFFDS